MRPHPPRTAASIEDQVLAVRRELAQSSDLGFHGAEAIHDALSARGLAGPAHGPDDQPHPPQVGVSSIDRSGSVAVPRPWVGTCPRWRPNAEELDCFDVVEGLVIKDGPQVEVLNGVSLHGGLAVSWPREASLTAKVFVDCLIEHWKAVGLPGYAQFDNDTIFQGPTPTRTWWAHWEGFL